MLHRLHQADKCYSKQSQPLRLLLMLTMQQWIAFTALTTGFIWWKDWMCLLEFTIYSNIRFRQRPNTSDALSRMCLCRFLASLGIWSKFRFLNYSCNVIFNFSRVFDLKLNPNGIYQIKYATNLYEFKISLKDSLIFLGGVFLSQWFEQFNSWFFTEHEKAAINQHIVFIQVHAFSPRWGSNACYRCNRQCSPPQIVKFNGGKKWNIFWTKIL